MATWVVKWEIIEIHKLKWLFICLSVLFAVLIVFKVGCTTEEFGKTGFKVTLSVTGMTQVTSVFSVINSLQKINDLVIEDATYKVVDAILPFGKIGDETNESVLENKIGLRLKPDAPKYFIVKVQALSGADPANGVNKAISERVKVALIEAVADLGFEASIETMEIREATSMKLHKFGFK